MAAAEQEPIIDKKRVTALRKAVEPQIDLIVSPDLKTFMQELEQDLAQQSVDAKALMREIKRISKEFSGTLDQLDGSWKEIMRACGKGVEATQQEIQESILEAKELNEAATTTTPNAPAAAG